MISVLIVSSDNNFFSDLASNETGRHKMNLTRARSGEQALVMVAGHPYSLVVADEQLPDMTGLGFLEKVIWTNPMINCAAASGLSADEFHEASEGLGILMQLPLSPGPMQATELMERLENILNLSANPG